MSATPVAAERAGASPIARSRLGVAAGAPAVVLFLVVGVSTALRATVGLQVASPWILPDEIVYSELAKSIADGSRPSIRDIPTFGWGELYPTLIAPAWILFDNGFWAYHAALVINALLMSSAAVPAYFLARMFVSPRASLVVSAMTVAIPSMSYTGVVMTENACYPVFILALWLMARAIRDPTSGSQALAILALGLVALTRIQGLALVGAYAVGIATHALTGKPAARRAYVRRFVPSVALGLAAPLAIVLLSVARGDGPFGWLGARSGTFDALRLSEVPEWFAYLAAGLVLYVAVIPAAATLLMILRGLVGGATEEARLFAAISLPTLLAMLGSIALVSASLDVDGTENLNERYVFYVVPVMFVGLALWIREALPRGAPAFIVAVACCVAVVVLPIERLEYNASFQSVALIPWMGLRVSGIGLTALVAAFAAAAAALWLTVPANRAGRLWLFTAAAMAVTGALTVVSNLNSASNSASAFRGQAATWVDDALAPGDQVAVLWGERPSTTETPRRWYFWVMVTEFFNSSVGDVHRFGRPTYHEGFLPTRPVTLTPDGTLVGAGGQAVTAQYALVACQTRVEGVAVARAPRGALEVVKVDQPLRLAQPRRCARPAS